MICSGCKSENLALRRFCGDCGKSLTKNCQRCDFANALADRYCGGCGEPLSLTVRPVARTQSGVRPVALAAAPPSAPTALAPGGHSDELPQITPHELGELMRRKPSLATSAPALSAKVSQDDLDQLFGSPR